MTLFLRFGAPTNGGPGLWYVEDEYGIQKEGQLVVEDKTGAVQFRTEGQLVQDQELRVGTSPRGKE